MAKPNQTPQGVPVRRGAYNYENRHGALNDVNQDQQVSFADTFLGDLLGFDGQAGAQGAGMMDSIRGARRGVIESPRPQARPEDMPIDDPLAESPRPQARPEQAQPGGPMQGPDQPGTSDEIPRDENGNPLAVAAGVAAGAAAAGVAAKKILKAGERVVPAQKGEVAITPDENGNVRVPVQTNRGARYESLTAQQAADAGWTVVGLNYEDSGLPAPEEAPRITQADRRANANQARAGGGGIDAIDGDVTDGSTSKRPNQVATVDGSGSGNVTIDGTATDVTDSANGPATGDPATDAIDVTPEAQGRVAPPGSTVVQQLPEGLQEVPSGIDGVPSYRGGGSVYVPLPDGGYLDVTSVPREMRQETLRKLFRAFR